MNRSRILSIALLALTITGATWWMSKNPSHAAESKRGPLPVWLEADSGAAIASRTRADFPLTFDEALEAVRQQHPEVTEEDLRDFITLRYMEAMVIDDTLRIHRKSPRNLNLLNPQMNGGARRRGDRASAARISYVDSVLDFKAGRNETGGAHEVTYSFRISVPYDEALRGDSLRVWMPLPMATRRQSQAEILSASQSDYVLSGPEKSVHSTIYFEGPAPEAEGDTAVFEYTARFITRGQYASPEEILAGIRPYDKNSEEYRRYTTFEAPHIIRLDSLAREIVGDETNPFRQSEMVYDYIIERFPWAGAREYSTIPCIPEYVVKEGHGDCGQVSLLYISLMRTLGVPARWESGWMLHPGEKNLHDWAEVYFEGLGWIPVDVSFGRYTTSPSKAVQEFYSHGMDAHRFATNRGVCGELYPPKGFVRSETVDFQLGEVESSRGNLFYPAWNQHMTLIDIHPVK
ncbi:MAG: transglutaminase domain-containing protein [Muribaculaceae bacterium]|nr:transglutaminase domain-containing protein [Muribaculaceae bacterium]